MILCALPFHILEWPLIGAAILALLPFLSLLKKKEN
jgi:hypothetical protein